MMVNGVRILNDSAQIPSYLSTRFQCTHNNVCPQERMESHLRYQYIGAPAWRPGFEATLRRSREAFVQKALSTQKSDTRANVDHQVKKGVITVCMFGDSHAREMYYLLKHPPVDLPLRLVYLNDVKFPSYGTFLRFWTDFNADWLKMNICSMIVFNLGELL